MIDVGMLGTVLSRYKDYNFFMTPRILKIVMELSNCNLDNDFIRMEDGSCLIPPVDKTKINVKIDYEGFYGIGVRKPLCCEYIYTPKRVFGSPEMKKILSIYERKLNKSDVYFGKLETYVKDANSIQESKYINELDCKIMYVDHEPIGYVLYEKGEKYVHLFGASGINKNALYYTYAAFFNEVSNKIGLPVISDGKYLDLRPKERVRYSWVV